MRNLPTSFFRFEGRDQTWNSRAESFLEVNRPLLTAIDVESQLLASPNEITLGLKAGGIIGAAPLFAPDTRKVIGGVIVHPRFGWEGVGSILNRIGWKASPQILNCPLVPGSANEIPPWVLAGPILSRLCEMLKEIKRGFIETEEVRQTPRGQIMWQRYVSHELAQGSWHHIPCKFPELGYDPYLRSYIKWGLEVLYHSLTPFITIDILCGLLANQTREILTNMNDIQARYPGKRDLTGILKGIGLPSKKLLMGIQALEWLVDERGLAGNTEQDGLAWAMPMSDIFEKWLCYLVSKWARLVGGSVSLGYQGQTLIPLDWEQHSFDTLNSLVPDLVVRVGDHTYIFDAKYKGHLDDIDERRWLETKGDFYEQHRHDIHQVLAYASMYGTSQVTAILAYPMRLASWQHLVNIGKSEMKASIYHDNRHLRLILLGVPLQFAPGDFEEHLLRNWMNVL
jgi:hypothetical protein